MDTDYRTGDEAGPCVVADRYQLGAIVGIGASAQVHRAWDPVVGRAVAVKLFHATSSAHDRVRQRQEVRTLARLAHPGLVILHDGGVEAGRAFVVTDLVEGPTLAERITVGPLPVDAVRSLGARLADALAHVHAAGIVHRDVKPANVLLGDGGCPRLADFGIARALDATGVTGTGTVVGTAAYLAPEQVRGEPVGPAADVYALGLVLLEALTGRREYQGLAVESALARLHRAPDIPAGVPAEMAAVLRAMTDLDPARRPSAASVAATLPAGPAAAAASAAGRAPMRPDDGPPTVGIRATPRRRFAPSPVAAAELILLTLTGVAAAMIGTTGPAAVPADAGAARPVAPAVVAPVGPPPDATVAAPPARTGPVERVVARDPAPVAQAEPVRDGAPGASPGSSPVTAPQQTGSAEGYADQVRSWIAVRVPEQKADARDVAEQKVMDKGMTGGPKGTVESGGNSGTKDD